MSQSLAHKGAKRGAKGFLSLEMGLVLLVVSIAIVSAVLYYRDNLRKIAINDSTQHILGSAANLRAKSRFPAR